MENKKLNLNRPLLSVRKYPTVTSKKDEEKNFDNTLLVIPRFHHNEPELKPGPVRNPGAVPFQWERIPGRPKEDIKPKLHNEAKNVDSVEENNEAYVNAIGTLSRTQSFFLNCSLNDLDAKPFETGQNEPEKNGRDRDLLGYGPSFTKRFTYHDDAKEHGNFHGVCGLIRRFRLKGSLCVLNPVHVMNVRTREAISRASLPSHSNEPKSISNLKPVGKTRRDEVEESKVSSRNEIDRSENNNTLTENDSSNGKGFKTFRELLLADENSPQELDSGKDSVFEKTLYVDTIQKVKSPSKRSFSPNPQDIEQIPCSSEEDEDTSIKSMDQRHIIDSSVEDSIHKWNLKSSFEMREDFNQDSNTLEYTQVDENDGSENLEKQKTREKTSEYSNRKYSEFPVLPKSPSDSWLWRTLPTISGKNVSQRLNPHKPSFSKVPTNDVKWKAIVKSSKLQRPNLHYSEEILRPTPET